MELCLYGPVLWCSTVGRIGNPSHEWRRTGGRIGNPSHKSSRGLRVVRLVLGWDNRRHAPGRRRNAPRDRHQEPPRGAGAGVAEPLVPAGTRAGPSEKTAVGRDGSSNSRTFVDGLRIATVSRASSPGTNESAPAGRSMVNHDLEPGNSRVNRAVLHFVVFFFGPASTAARG
jgi:hypothetical protein